jgi:hypothetical protein
MKFNQFLLAVLGSAVFLLSGCTINQDILFRSGEFYEFADLDDLNKE